MTRRLVSAAVTSLALLTGCGGSSPAVSSSPTTLGSLFAPRFSASSLQGTWSGTMREGSLFFGNQRTAQISLRFSAAQADTTYTGTWQVTSTEPARTRSGSFSSTPPVTNVILGERIWEIVLTLRSSAPPPSCEDGVRRFLPDPELSLSPMAESLYGTLLEFDCDYAFADVTLRRQ
jgi:hypothetical protein